MFFFGESVSISDEYAIVSAPGFTSGSAYVFKRDGDVWTEQAKLTAGDDSENTLFGESVSISGEYAIVGASGFASGSAYVFKRNGDVWTKQAKLTAGDDSENTLFGESVSISGEYAIVGATDDDEHGDDSGAAYVFAFPTANITADPETTRASGDAATLSWTSTHAEAVIIDNGVGEVPLNGSITVFPTETTTYTITASGTLGTAQASVTVTVGYTLPTVSISASPEAIQFGASSTITWDTEHADSCVIEPDIGDVPINGSISVSPAETKTYVITATGLGVAASASATVTVIHPEPGLSISANPEAIQLGESSTLTWTATNADNCVIEPGIGSVDVTGSITVSPTGTTTYTITATGAGGTTAADVTVTAMSPMTLEITSPLDGEWISGPDIMVQCTVTNAQSETGVTINGTPAMVYGGQFAANHVLLQEGENNITADARDMEGNTASASITINVDIMEDYIRLSADTESCVAPFETTLKVDGSFSFTESSMTCIGLGAVEYIDNPNEYEYTVRMTTPGIYYCTAEVEDAENNIYTDTIAIGVMDEVELDALLRAKWDGMKAALGNQNIENALDYFSEHKKGLYEEIYTTLYDNLPQIVQDMQDIEFIYAEDNLAKYRIRKDELYGLDGGEILTITYYIYFSKDEKGLWKIYRY